MKQVRFVVGFQEGADHRFGHTAKHFIEISKSSRTKKRLLALPRKELLAEVRRMLCRKPSSRALNLWATASELTLREEEAGAALTRLAQEAGRIESAAPIMDMNFMTEEGYLYMLSRRTLPDRDSVKVYIRARLRRYVAFSEDGGRWVRIVCYYSNVGERTLEVDKEGKGKIAGPVTELYKCTAATDLGMIVKFKTVPMAEWTNWTEHFVSFSCVVAGRDNWEI
jgi:hypothetical protein